MFTTAILSAALAFSTMPMPYMDSTDGSSNKTTQGPHIRHDIIEAMEYTRIHLRPGWPLYSPDLNVIEIVWAIMKLRVQQQKPKAVNDRKRVIQEVWDGISLDTITLLVTEMPRSLVAVIRSEGRTAHHI